jgi:hypothetical protein
MPRNLYSSSSHLGGSQSVHKPSSEGSDKNTRARDQPRRERLLLHFRDGTTASYPYHFLSLVEMRGHEEIILYCTCGSLQRITIKGRNLGEIADALLRQDLERIKEDARPEFLPPDRAVIDKITLVRPPTR